MPYGAFNGMAVHDEQTPPSARFADGRDLAGPGPPTFYAGGEKGYNDYPTA